MARNGELIEMNQGMQEINLTLQVRVFHQINLIVTFDVSIKDVIT